MNQDFQIRHESKHYRPCNQYKHRFHRSHHRSLLGGWSVNDKGFIVFVHPIFFNKYITAPYLRQKEEDYWFILLSFVKHILNSRSDIFEMHFRGGSL